MFTNPGRKLKGFAQFFFWLSVLGTIILAFVFGIVEEIKGTYFTYTETVFHAEIFFSTLIIGIILSYVESLCLYGFGELIENSAKNNVPVKPISVLEDIETNLPNL